MGYNFYVVLIGIFSHPYFRVHNLGYEIKKKKKFLKSICQGLHVNTALLLRFQKISLSKQYINIFMKCKFIHNRTPGGITVLHRNIINIMGKYLKSSQHNV